MASSCKVYLHKVSTTEVKYTQVKPSSSNVCHAQVKCAMLKQSLPCSSKVCHAQVKSHPQVKAQQVKSHPHVKASQVKSDLLHVTASQHHVTMRALNSTPKAACVFFTPRIPEMNCCHLAASSSSPSWH